MVEFMPLALKQLRGLLKPQEESIEVQARTSGLASMWCGDHKKRKAD